MVGWVYEMKIRLNSASVVVEVEVEVEAELGNSEKHQPSSTGGTRSQPATQSEANL